MDGSPALESASPALVSSGEGEDVSGAQVERKLRDWLNRRKHNKTSWIPELEQTITRVERGPPGGSPRPIAPRRGGPAESGRAPAGAGHTLAVELAYHKAAAEQKKRTAWEQAQSELSQAPCGREEKYRAELRRDGMTPDREVLRRTQEGAQPAAMWSRSSSRPSGTMRRPSRPPIEAPAGEASDPLFAGMSPEEAWDKANLDADEVDLEERPPGEPLAAGLCCWPEPRATAAAGVLLTPLPFWAQRCCSWGSFCWSRMSRLKRQAATIQGGAGKRSSPGTAWEDSEEILALAREYRAGGRAPMRRRSGSGRMPSRRSLI